MEVRRQPIGVELVKRGIVKSADIAKALEYQKSHSNKKLGDILYILELCDPDLLIKAIGEIIGLPGRTLNNTDIKIDIKKFMAPEACLKNKAIPFDLIGNEIKVCFADTVDVKAMENVKTLMSNKGLTVKEYITFETNIERIIRAISDEVVEEIDLNGQEYTSVNIIDSIIRKGMDKRASDIHFEPQNNEIRVRYRIDGELFTVAKLPNDIKSQIIGRLKAISNMHQEKQESQDGRIILYDDYNIRVSSQKNIHGEKFVLRLLKKNAKIRDIFELGYPGDEDTLRKSVSKKNSLTVVAAPTGAGKTTTLYSLIDYLNSPDINVTTIEDPVEIRIEGLNQIEIDEKEGFSEALRTVLRQDPDIILVGEIRDLETAEIAIQAGQTGHYVLATIHTIDSVEVITRLRKVGISNYDISSTLATTMSQRLIRRLCPNCKKERPFSKKEKEIMTEVAAKFGEELDFQGKNTFDAIGCPKCNNSGYFERIGVFEILNITDELKELIMEGKSSIEIRRVALQGEYRPLIFDGLNKVLQGYTDLEELNKELLIY